MYYRYSISFALFFSLSAMENEQENISQQNKWYIFHQSLDPLYCYLGPAELAALQLLDKDTHMRIINRQAGYTVLLPDYRIHLDPQSATPPEHKKDIVYSSYGDVGYLQDICTLCYNPSPCINKNCVEHKYNYIHERLFAGSFYTGMLVRWQKDTMREYKAFIMHRCMQKLMQFKSIALSYQEDGIIQHVETNVHIPDDLEITYSNDRPLVSYVGKPSFNYFGNLCVLEGILRKNKQKLYECELTPKNTCTRRDAYFVLQNTTHRLHLLHDMPYLLSYLDDQIGNGQCCVERTDAKVLFTSSDFFKKHLPNWPTRIPLLQDMFREIKQYTDPKSILTKVLFYKLAGNIDAAEKLLIKFDRDRSCHLAGDRRQGYFNHIYLPGDELPPYRDTILPLLVDEESIESLLTAAELDMVYWMPLRGSARYRVEKVRKGFEYTLKLWQEKDDTWEPCNATYLLTNCIDLISDITFRNKEKGILQVVAGNKKQVTNNCSGLSDANEYRIEPGQTINAHSFPEDTYNLVQEYANNRYSKKWLEKKPLSDIATLANIERNTERFGGYCGADEELKKRYIASSICRTCPLLNDYTRQSWLPYATLGSTYPNREEEIL